MYIHLNMNIIHIYAHIYIFSLYAHTIIYIYIYICIYVFISINHLNANICTCKYHASSTPHQWIPFLSALAQRTWLSRAAASWSPRSSGEASAWLMGFSGRPLPWPGKRASASAAKNPAGVWTCKQPFLGVWIVHFGSLCQCLQQLVPLRWTNGKSRVM